MDTTDTSKDQYLRKEFARAFGWFKKKDYYDSTRESEPRTPTWEEIFIEVGRLLAQRDFRDFEGNISEIECALADIKKLSNPTQ